MVEITSDHNWEELRLLSDSENEPMEGRVSFVVISKLFASSVHGVNVFYIMPIIMEYGISRQDMWQSQVDNEHYIKNFCDL